MIDLQIKLILKEIGDMYCSVQGQVKKAKEKM